MRNKLFALAFLACAACCGAAETNIERKGNMEIITDFNSAYTGLQTIRILLPDNYDGSSAHYPVLYMHDGQNLFSDDDAVFGASWDLPKTLKRLKAQKRMKDIIVVAVDSRPSREDDYTPYPGPEGTGGHAAEYANFLCLELIPYVDNNYRTVANAGGRAVMGSSHGGLLSLYLALTKNQSFSMFGVMSPSVWFAKDALFKEIEKTVFPKDIKIWLDCGVYETRNIKDSWAETFPSDVAELYYALRAKKLVYGKNLLFMLDENGVHHEKSWAARMEYPLLQFFGTRPRGAIVKAEGRVLPSALTLHPPQKTLFWGRVKFADGTIADYLPDTAKSSPPYLSWDGRGWFSLRSGAEAGQVRLSAEAEGKKFTSAVTLAANLTRTFEFEVRVPAGTKGDVFIAGQTPALGDWKADGIRLIPFKKNPTIRHARVRLALGTPVQFKFTLGDWDAVEKGKSGKDIANRVLVPGPVARKIRFKVESW